METMYSILLQFLLKLFFHPFVLIASLFVIYFCKSLFTKLAIPKNLPPSPPKLPIVGHLHQLGLLPHRSLQSLSQQYGQLMFLYLGSTPTLVVTSAEVAQLIFQTHDTIFCSRPKSHAASILFYGRKDVAFSPYGEYWRKMRAICVQQLLSSKKVQSFRRVREEEVALMVEEIKRSGASVLNLSGILTTYTDDLISFASFNNKCSGDQGTFVNLKQLLDELMKLLGVVSMGDFIPWLSWVDNVNGLEGRLQNVAEQLDVFLEKVIQEHQDRLSAMIIEDDSDKGEKVQNFLDILLDLQRENKDALSMESVKSVLLDMFVGGTDTSYTLMEWAIFELIRHPRVMKELQEEVRKIVKGKDSKVLCGDDLEQLPYLNAVIKEVLRLHPPAPLLMFRESLQEVKINGFDISAGTQVIINAWAIQRDPTFWTEAEEFRPERFLNTSSFDYRGQNFHYIPFGVGRRGCPGISFAIASAQLVIATLMYEFDWKFPDGIDHEKVDMTEAPGLTVRRRDPLMVIATSLHLQIDVPGCILVDLNMDSKHNAYKL